MATEIKGSQIRDETVTAADLGPNSVSSSELASTAISLQTEKNPAVNGDFVLISDSADSGALKKVQVGNLGVGGGSQDVFKTIAVSGQSNVVADSASDTLTLIAGSNITLTTNAGSDSITVAASGGGDSDMIEDADNNTKIEVEANADENKIRLTTNGVERMIIDENGKVGIGRTPTVGILEVNGEVLMSGGTLSTDSVDVGRDIGGHINLIRDVNNITDGAALGVIHFAGTEDAGSNFGEGAWIASYASEAWNVGSAEGANLRFYTQTNGSNTGPTERMRIANSGKVGIGISTPSLCCT